MSYDNSIVKKPWGYEYLVYENDEIGIWFLNISKDQSTSLHCHPKKNTGLIILDGIGEITCLPSIIPDGKKIIKGLGKTTLRRGLFHSTKALSDSLLLLEVETPKDKHDLVRLSDNYGREFKSYEDSSFEIPKKSDCLWIEEPVVNKFNTYEFGNCILTVENISDIDIINNKLDADLLIFLKGGLVRTIEGEDYLVTVPGEVGLAYHIKQISTKLDGVVDNTIILTIRKD
jgi:mannose-6-phosphate isomerase-like protein (cupin superfamily)